MTPPVCDYRGAEIGIGDTVIFILNPHQLGKGTVTGLRRLNQKLTVVDVVTDHSSVTVNTIPSLCYRLS